MDYREKLLEEKANEISKELEGWAKDNLSLKQNEFIALSLTLEERPITQIKQVAVNPSRGPKTHRTNQTLADQDWEKILSLPFSSKQKDIFNLFRQNNNKPLLPNKIEEFIHQNIKKYAPSASNDFGYGQLSGINSIFSRLRYPYRLLEDKKEWSYHTWGELPIRMFIVKY